MGNQVMVDADHLQELKRTIEHIHDLSLCNIWYESKSELDAHLLEDVKSMQRAIDDLSELAIRLP